MKIKYTLIHKNDLVKGINLLDSSHTILWVGETKTGNILFVTIKTTTIKNILKMELPFESMEKSLRNILKAAKIETYGELMNFTQEELLKFRGFGVDKLKLVTKLLDRKKLMLRNSPIRQEWIEKASSTV